jgi:branched-chain amino acid transport system permease protein
MKVQQSQARAVFLAAVLATIVIFMLGWRDGANVSTRLVSQSLVSSLFYGSVYAILASGLVVTYVTSGVFNFAQGAVAMASAFLYWELRVDREWPAPIALFVVVLVAAPLFGAFIEKLLMRELRSASLVAKITVTVGLMLTIMGLVAMIWEPGTARNIPPFFGSTAGFKMPVAEVFVTWHRTITVLVGIGIAILLRALLYGTRTGVAMRAVVDSPDLAGLNGAPPERVSRVSWMLSSSMAATAGILIAPELSILAIEDITFLIVIAFSAAIIGKLRSLPLTFLGGLLLGLYKGFAASFIESTGRWQTFKDAIPGILLIVALLAVPQARLELSRAMRSVRTIHVPKVWETALGMGIFWFVMVLVTFFWIDDEGNLLRIQGAAITALFLLSLVPLIGWAGQVSLAHYTLVGVGAVGMLKVDLGALVTFDFDGAWSDAGPQGTQGLLAGALLAVPFGLLLAVPSLRLQGLYLALASMAFAIVMDDMFFKDPAVLGGSGNAVRYDPLSFFGVEFENTRATFLFLVALFGVLATALVALRRSAYGRRLVALRDSPAACATLGVNVMWTKVAVFTLTAAMAGLAGACLGAARGTIATTSFELQIGLPFVLLLVVGGMACVSGALFGGIFSIFLVLIQDELQWNLLRSFTIIGPGLAAIGIGKNPLGAVVEIGHGFAKFLPWRHDAKAADAAERRKLWLADPARLGVELPFTEEAVRVVEHELALPEDARAGHHHRVAKPSPPGAKPGGRTAAAAVASLGS